MELIFSSPVPIVALFFAILIIGVFIFELKMKKREKEIPQTAVPPVTIPLPVEPAKKNKNLAVFVAGGIILLLLISLSVLFILTRQRQGVQKKASETGPFLTEQSTTPPPENFSVSPTGSTTTFTNLANQLPSCLSVSATPTSGRAPLTITLETHVQDIDDGISAVVFNFGDTTSKRIEKSFPKATEAIQTIDHVYNEPGNYQVTIHAEDTKKGINEDVTNCTTTVEVLSASGSQNRSVGGVASGSSPTPTVTKKPLPTNIPAATVSATLPAKIATKSAIPKLPEAGNDWPTLLFGVGGIIFVFTSLALVL